MKIRHRKGQDSHQKEVWERYKARMLQVFREDPNGQFGVRVLSHRIGLSPPSIRRHLSVLERAKIVLCDHWERPAMYVLRPFWPMPDELVEKTKDTLKYADAPPDAITFPLSTGKHATIVVTLLWTRKECLRHYKLILKQEVRLEDQLDTPDQPTSLESNTEPIAVDAETRDPASSNSGIF
jgi:DNA-binding transcriptional ArsR family regulator